MEGQGQATRQGILDAFKALETKTEGTVDPCIIIYYAGHGASSPRPDGWEDWATDRNLIEQLCPSDIGTKLEDQSVKEIRKKAFDRAETRWWEVREQILAMEDEQEAAGIGEVVSLDQRAADGAAGRRR